MAKSQSKASAAAAALTLNGAAGPKAPVTATQVWAFINGKAGGNPSNVRVVPLPNVNKAAPAPLPFANMAKAGKRASILWALVNGTPVPNGKATDTLDHWLRYSVKHGASGHALADLLAALNGGYSASSKYYGTPYIQLVVTPAAPAPKSGKAEPKAKAAPAAPKAKAAPKADAPAPAAPAPKADAPKADVA